MDHAEVVRRRRMVRAFRPDPIDAATLERIIDAGLRGPTAGNSVGVDLVVLEGAEQTERYWSVTLAGVRRERFSWPRLLDAPVLIVVTCSPAAYVARYAEPDKAATGLGAGPAAWPVPYWFVDAGAATMALLYAAVAEGLGACLFGAFEHEAAIAQRLGVPAEHRLASTVAVGHAAPDRPGRSARRHARRGERVHRGGWTSPMG